MLKQERLHHLFEYVDGDLVRRVDINNQKAGTVAGFPAGGGYLGVSVDGARYKVHRLVWLYHHGYFPENELDHIDREKTNNRISNLREVSRSCNMRNTKVANTNTSGVTGVCWHKGMGKWRSSVGVNRKKINLGSHSSFAEAVCHRLAAEQAEDWAGCNSSSPAYLYVSENIKTNRIKWREQT